jgi:hypothetical protein
LTSRAKFFEDLLAGTVSKRNIMHYSNIRAIHAEKWVLFKSY